MLTIIETNLFNADFDRRAEAITSDQYNAIVRITALDYTALSTLPPRAEALQPQIIAVIDAIENAAATDGGASFDPSNPGYYQAASALRDGCASSGFPVTYFGGPNTGG